jgi:HK97 family phage prohead protease|nr:MAG TPA: head maturation protease [Caudoviricetes sp.]
MKIEVRNGAVNIEGYVNVTERLSKPIRDVRGQFLERVATGAFNSALQRNDNVELRFNHGRKLGDQKDGSLELREDNIGLYAKATVTDTEVVKLAEERQLKGWSFGFRKLEDEWTKADNEPEIRTLKAIDVSEVSILSVNPAYIATSITVRADDGEELTECRANDSATGVVQYDIEKREADEKPNEAFHEVIENLKK